MFVRRLVQAGVAIGMLAVSVLGLSSPANAVPTSFVAKAVHAGGAGKLAVQATGGLTWYNRSVTVTSVKFYASPGECGYVAIWAYVGNADVDHKFYPSSGSYCGGSTGKWFTVGNVPLDGSAYSGGITEVYIVVFDETHSGQGWALCARASFACSTAQM
ncbi:hypothetical protein [Catellatospora sichuanensis]|uniref:hypothetical protein n=1 Tax=Catellatospora sichuanensis TaxID=1969805 RepID=UPI001183F5D6|nr:hypothetical protein [Catellatospora sichuanensis]